MEYKVQDNQEEREVFVEKVPEMSLMTKVTNVVTAPKVAFENIKEYPNIGGPALIGMLLMAIYAVLSLPHSGLTTMNLYNNMAEVGIPNDPSAYESLLNPTVLVIITTCITAAITYLVSWGISGLFYFISAKIFGLKNITLKHIYSVTAYVNIPITLILMVGAILNSYVIKSGVDVFSLAVLTSKVNYSSLLYCLLASLSIVSIYQAAILGIGFSVVSEVKTVKGVLASATITVITIIFAATMMNLPFLLVSFIK